MAGASTVVITSQATSDRRTLVELQPFVAETGDRAPSFPCAMR
jgi:hypothetical protein